MRKRACYIHYLFHYRDTSARGSLFQSLVLPLYGYCCPVPSPKDESSLDILEKSVIKFVKSLQLKSSRNDYKSGLDELGWDCLFIKRLKRSLTLVYHLVFELVPYVDDLFAPHEFETARDSVAGNTRSQQKLCNRPHALQPTGSTLAGVTVPASEDSFACQMAQLWNAIDFPESAYRSLSSFKAALDAVGWKSLPLIKAYTAESHLGWFWRL